MHVVLTHYNTFYSEQRDHIKVQIESFLLTNNFYYLNTSFELLNYYLLGPPTTLVYSNLVFPLAKTINLSIIFSKKTVY